MPTKETVCDSCHKLRRDVRAFPENGACFVCRTEWTERGRVWSKDHEAYVPIAVLTQDD